MPAKKAPHSQSRNAPSPFKKIRALEAEVAALRDDAGTEHVRARELESDLRQEQTHGLLTGSELADAQDTRDGLLSLIRIAQRAGQFGSKFRERAAELRPRAETSTPVGDREPRDQKKGRA